MASRDVPHTIDEAVRLLRELLDPDELASIQALSEDRLLHEHFGVAVFIRDAFRLWRGNDPLLRATGSPHPDDASMVILQALWQVLQGTGQPHLH